MANVVSVQLTEDGPKNVVLKVDMSLDTSNLTGQLIYDPSAHYQDPWSPINSVAIDEIQYAVASAPGGNTVPFSVQLLWDATTAVSIVHLEGRGKFPMDWAGGIPNNAGAGRTGKIICNTYGWQSTNIMYATLFMQLHKTAL